GDAPDPLLGGAAEVGAEDQGRPLRVELGDVGVLHGGDGRLGRPGGRRGVALVGAAADEDLVGGVDVDVEGGGEAAVGAAGQGGGEQHGAAAGVELADEAEVLGEGTLDNGVVVVLEGAVGGLEVAGVLEAGEEAVAGRIDGHAGDAASQELVGHVGRI